MNIPNFINTKIVDENGMLTETWSLIFMQLFSELQNGISNEGIKVPNQTTTNINILNTNNVDGTLITDSNLHKLKVWLTNGFKNIVTESSIGPLTPNTAVITDSASALTSSVTTATEISYVNGVTSSIQTQINNKEALIISGTSIQYWRGDKSWQLLNTSVVPEGTNLYFTEDRARNSISNSAPITYSALTGVIGITQSGTASDGYLSSTDWNIFNNKQDALTFGDISETTSSVLTITNGLGVTVGPDMTIEVKQASTTQDGYLSSTDWNTFNNKENAVIVYPLVINGVPYVNASNKLETGTRYRVDNSNANASSFIVASPDNTKTITLTTNQSTNISQLNTNAAQLEFYANSTKRLWVDTAGQINFTNYKFPLADGTNRQILMTDGAGSLYWRTILPKSFLTYALAASSYGTRLLRTIGTNGAWRMDFFVPADFQTLDKVWIIGYPSAGAAGINKNIDFNIEYTTTVGAAYNQYIAADTTSLWNLTGYSGKKYQFDITYLFTNLGPNTEGGILVSHNGIGGEINYVGVLIQYY